MGKSKVSVKKDNTLKILIVVSIISLLVVGGILFQFFILSNSSANTVGQGVVINGQNLTGMSSSEAVEYVSAYFKDMAESFELNIRDKDKTWTLTNEDFEVNSDVFSIIEASQIHSKEVETKEKQINLLNLLIKQGTEVNVAFNYIFTGLDEKIENIIKEVEVEPVNSEITFNPDSENMFEISDSVNGLRVDRARLYDDINAQFLKTNKINVVFDYIEEEPEVTREYNEALTKKISSYSTDVSDSTGGRKKNVKLALEKFNGMRIEPNEEVSFNKVTGPHSLANGYQVATIILNSRFVDGVGGGICQASTTLYNALIRAGVEIVEVNKHTLPVRYVPLACDAMVAEYISDLKFKNTTGYPIFIKTSSDANTVYVDIFSHEIPDGITYDLESETVKTLKHNGDVIKPDTNKEYTDKVLYKGEFYRLSYPRDGVEANAYLITKKDGKEISRELIRHEIYKPQNGVLIEGVENLPESLNAIDDKVEIFSSGSEVDLDNLNFMHGTIPSFLCP